MASLQGFGALRSRTISCVGLLSLVIDFWLTLSPPANAQTFSVLHSFTGHEGASIYGGISLDAQGNIYGTAFNGGAVYGTAFRLTKHGTAWMVSTLHNFTGGSDGGGPTGTMVFGPDGNLYGIAEFGGSGPCVDGNLTGCGAVFKLSPGVSTCKRVSCPWTETVLHNFMNFPDGSSPLSGVTFDREGNIYGTTYEGGIATQDCQLGCGTVYELTPSNGSWTETVLYRFAGGADGAYIAANVILDSAGNLYGTASNVACTAKARCLS